LPSGSFGTQPKSGVPSTLSGAARPAMLRSVGAKGALPPDDCPPDPPVPVASLPVEFPPRDDTPPAAPPAIGVPPVPRVPPLVTPPFAVEPASRPTPPLASKPPLKLTPPVPCAPPLFRAPAALDAPPVAKSPTALVAPPPAVIPPDPEPAPANAEPPAEVPPSPLGFPEQASPSIGNNVACQERNIFMIDSPFPGVCHALLTSPGGTPELECFSNSSFTSTHGRRTDCGENITAPRRED